MKKLISLFLCLTLCCLLIPAVAEDASPVGTWYMTRAEKDDLEIKVTDNEGITLVMNEDNTFTMTIKGIGSASSGTWSFADGKLTVTVDGESTELALNDGELLYEMEGASIYLSQTPAEPFALSPAAPAESADAFNGDWTPYAEVAYGMYGVLPPDTVNEAGSLKIQGGKITVLYGTTEAAAYDTELKDGSLYAEDNTYFPTSMTATLLEDGTLDYNTVMQMGEGQAIEMALIYVRAE